MRSSKCIFLLVVFLSCVSFGADLRYRQFDKFWISSGIYVDGEFWYKSGATNYMTSGQDYSELAEACAERIAILTPEFAFNPSGVFTSTNFYPHLGTNKTPILPAFSTNIFGVSVIDVLDWEENYYYYISEMRTALTWSPIGFYPSDFLDVRSAFYSAPVYDSYFYRNVSSSFFLDSRFEIDDYIDGKTILEYTGYDILKTSLGTTNYYYVSTNGVLKTDLMTTQTRSSILSPDNKVSQIWSKPVFSSINNFSNCLVDVWSENFPYLGSWEIYPVFIASTNPLVRINTIPYYGIKEQSLKGTQEISWWNYIGFTNNMYILGCENDFKTNEIDITIVPLIASLISCNTNSIKLEEGTDATISFNRLSLTNTLLSKSDCNAGVSYSLQTLSETSVKTGMVDGVTLKMVSLVTDVVTNCPFKVDNVIVSFSSEQVSVVVKRNWTASAVGNRTLRIDNEISDLIYANPSYRAVSTNDNGNYEFTFYKIPFLYGFESDTSWCAFGQLVVFDYEFGKLYLVLNVSGNNDKISPLIYSIKNDNVAIKMENPTETITLVESSDYRNFSLSALNKVDSNESMSDATKIIGAFSRSVYDLGSIDGNSYFSTHPYVVEYYATTNIGTETGQTSSELAALKAYCNSKIGQKVDTTNGIFYSGSVVNYEFYSYINDYETYTNNVIINSGQDFREGVESRIIMGGYTNCTLLFPNIYWYTNNYVSRVRIYCTINQVSQPYVAWANSWWDAYVSPYSSHTTILSKDQTFLSPIIDSSSYVLNYFSNQFKNGSYAFPTSYSGLNNSVFTALNKYYFNNASQSCFDSIRLSKIYDSADFFGGNVTTNPVFDITAPEVDVSKSSQFWTGAEYQISLVNGYGRYEYYPDPVYTTTNLVEEVGGYKLITYTFGNLYVVVDWNFKHCNLTTPFVPVNYTPPWMTASPMTTNSP